MAKVKLSPFSTGLSGKMSNLVFSQQKEGTIMRERISPSNPQTAAQVAVRTAFTKATKQWNSLTTAQVRAWKAYAESYSNLDVDTEKNYNSYGFNAFVKLAAKWYAVNGSGTAPANPPANPFAGDTISVTAAPVAGGVRFTASGANASGVTTALLLAKIGGKNRTANRKQYREKQYVTFKAGSDPVTVSVPAGWYAAGYSFVNLATGEESEAVLLGTIGGVTLSVEDTNSKKKAA